VAADTFVATPSPARLLIHVALNTGAHQGHFKSAVRRLRALYSDRPRRAGQPPLRIHIDDLHGTRVFAIDDAGPLIPVALPSGTYEVTAHLGNVRRSYTMTLLQGQAFDLHVCLTPDRPG